MHFGATLRLLRVDAGFTLRDLAERVGVSNAYLSRVENGHDAPPTPDRLVALARAFGLAPTLLFELADRLPPVTADYFEAVPAARELMLDLVRRKLTAVDVARIRAFVANEFPDDALAQRASLAAKLLEARRVIVGLACSDLEDVVDMAATRLLAKESAHSVDGLAQAILARERSCSTALGSGLAVPHAVVRGIEPRAVVVTLRSPLAVDTPDGVPLSLVVVHVHPGGPAHTSVLVQLARLAEPEVVAAVAALRAPDAIVRHLGSLLV